MMLNHYQASPLEQWIEKLFRNRGIRRPEQLTVRELSERFKIEVNYAPMQSFYMEYFNVHKICIDSRLSPEEQLEDFLHELCHALRHAGNQLIMPRPYVEWQEWDAHSFQLYAGVPYYMIKNYKLPHLKSEAIDLLALDFGITHKLAERRINQMQRRIFSELFYSAWKDAVSSRIIVKGVMRRIKY